jgi:pSer/pThr/pTyr-binding forkhead associated (FHA) protein
VEPLDEYLEDCRRFQKETFVKAHPHPWLVIATSQEETGDRWRAFRTTSVNSKSLARRADLPAVAEGYRVLRIAKTADNPWRNRISVGRARNNDMVIRDRSVSKLHAHFSFDEGGHALLTDAGSRNGTRVNGERIQGSDAVALVSGDELRIGRVEGVFQDSGAFFDFLRGLLED